MKKEILIVSILMLLHTIEESVFYFWQSRPTGLPSLNIYILGQIILYFLLAYTFFRSKSKILYGIIGLILLYEIIHIVTAWNMQAYIPGLVSAIFIVLFAIPYWIKLFTKSNLGTA